MHNSHGLSINGEMGSNGGKQVIVKAIPVNVISARELVRVLRNVAERLNLSVRETALSMGVPETNVKVMQYRALRRAANLESV